ncbi:cathelicidin-1-like isoform X1 [Hyla sarda]|uniref:cathelicidin-1-like isoform X1 n=1 Tax=Hyla sarda TaxID=327740 RepID=UPI0024C26BCB|nr:cathelicidin-1-like isoform X1 [Hyla sarda]
MATWVLCAAALLAAAASPTAGRTVPPSTSERPGASERAAYILQATTRYNSEDDGEVVYRPLRVPPEVESHDSENITFIIKETVCLKSDKKDKKCPFKEDGVVKNCTAPPPGHKGRRLKVRCQTVDTSDNGENNKSPGTMGNDPVYKLLPGKQNQRSDFLQFDNRRSQIGHSAASCISCIFDFLNTNPSGR